MHSSTSAIGPEGGGTADTQEGVGIFIVPRLRQKAGGKEWEGG